MDHAARVRGGEAFGNRGANPHRVTPGDGALLDPGAERLPLEQFHDGHRHAVDDGELMNRQNAGMRERGNRPRLGFESPPHLGVGRDVRGHHLDRHVAIEPRVAGAIDLAHAARTDGLDDLVLCEARAG